MKLLLILPDANIHRLKLGPIKISFREAPLTLTTLAALVPSELNAEITIIDESVQSIPAAEQYDVVAISCLTGTAHRAYEISKYFREKGSTVVLGGVHVTLRPVEALQNADAIVKGFAELAWPQLLRDFVRGQLKRVYEEVVDNLAGLPHPRRKLQKQYGYMAPNTVFATRGCKKTCDFCTVTAIPFGWSTRPVHEVIDEIRRIPAKRFVFNDVSLTEDRDYAMELFSALTPLNKEWGGLANLTLAKDGELLDLMCRSGCRYLLTGFESVSEQGLAGIGKQVNLSVGFKTAMEAFHAHQLIIQGCFIFGLDQDDTSVFERTVEMVHELKIDIPRYAIYTPYPETQAFKRLKREGRILHEYWPHYDTQHVVFQPLQMTPDELDVGFRHAYKETFRMGPIISRTLSSGHLPVAFFGNLAYLLYLRRMKNDMERLYFPSVGNRGVCHA